MSVIVFNDLSAIIAKHYIAVPTQHLTALFHLLNTNTAKWTLLGVYLFPNPTHNTLNLFGLGHAEASMVFITFDSTFYTNDRRAVPTTGDFGALTNGFSAVSKQVSTLGLGAPYRFRVLTQFAGNRVVLVFAVHMMSNKTDSRVLSDRLSTKRATQDRVFVVLDGGLQIRFEA